MLLLDLERRPTRLADAMLALAKEKRARLYIGHNMRHMPVVRQMKAIIDSGRIGRVRAIWCRHFVGAGGDFYFKDWHAERAKATSLLLQKGAHDIDVLASYQQCHFTPDYWRNYTVIGDAGRIENMGDGAGDQIHLWLSRNSGPGRPDEVEVIARAEGGHGGADPSLVAEFLRFARSGGRIDVSVIAAREAIATGVLGAESIRHDGVPYDVPALDPERVAYFDEGQPAQ